MAVYTRIILYGSFLTVMLDPEYDQVLRFEQLDLAEVKEGLGLAQGFVQAIDGPVTCQVLSGLLGREILPAHVDDVRLEPGECLIVVQEEMSIPPRVRFWRVSYQYRWERKPVFNRESKWQ